MEYKIELRPDGKYEVFVKGKLFWSRLIMAQRGSMIIPYTFDTIEEAEKKAIANLGSTGTGNTVVKYGKLS